VHLLQLPKESLLPLFQALDRSVHLRPKRRYFLCEGALTLGQVGLKDAWHCLPVCLALRPLAISDDLYP
jgi:hypothetical protein